MKTIRSLFPYLLIGCVTSILIYVIQAPLLYINEIIVTDTIIAGVISGILVKIIYSLLTYSRFNVLLFRQKIFIYIAIGILFVISWILLEYFFLYVVFYNTEFDFSFLAKFLPLRIVFVGLIYSILVIVYDKQPKNGDDKKISEDEQSEEEPDEIFSSVNLQPSGAILERIVVKNGTQVDILPVPEIIYLQAEGDYVKIHTGKGKYLKEQTMKSFEIQLPPEKFVRIHRSYIINVDFISQIEQYGKQNQLLKMKNGVQLKISQSGYKLLRQTLAL